MPKTSKPPYATPHILSDSPLAEEQDQPHFHFDDFAVTLARLIASRDTRTPLAICASGPWGSGKTTLLRRLQRQLDQTACLLERNWEKPAGMDFVNPDETPERQYRACRTVWFNAWKYADEDELLVALVRLIVQTMAGDGIVQKAIGKLLDPSYPRRDVVNTVLSWFSIKTPVGDVSLNTGVPQPTPFAEKTALLDLFDEAFDRLLAAWVHCTLDIHKIDPHKGVLVIFIDDLDRCLPDKTVQVLEAIKLFLDKPGCVFVLGADVEVVRQAVESYYQNARITGQNAADYLEKIIQLRFELPPVVAGDMQAYLQGQAVGDALLAQWQTLIAAAEVNPRRVKAVLNDIELQWSMLANSGQAAGVQRDDFIRWSALLRAAPANFRERVFDIDDLDLRHKFIQDALRWGQGEGDETLSRTFQEYEKASRRLRRVLRQIQAFSPDFDARTLDAFIHLAAPPPKLGPTLAVEAQEAIEVGEKVAVRAVSKGDISRGGEAHPDRRAWGGIEFVRVPAGKFLMGSKDDNPLAFDDEKPQHTVDIEVEFWIGRFPVTNAQFAAFVQTENYRTSAEERGSGNAYDGKEWKEVKGADWRHPRGSQSGLEDKDDHPAVLVSWLDARAFCRWLNQAHGNELPMGWQFRLPGEAEWEKAARGEYGNEWPWGSEKPDATRCNFEMNVGDTTLVGKYSPQGDSPYGAADMVGNVWEWTHTLFKNSPNSPDDGREAEGGSSVRVLRGGSLSSNLRLARCACRRENFADLLYSDNGFRVVVSPIQL